MAQNPRVSEGGEEWRLKRDEKARKARIWDRNEVLVKEQVFEKRRRRKKKELVELEEVLHVSVLWIVGVLVRVCQSQQRRDPKKDEVREVSKMMKMTKMEKEKALLVLGKLVDV